MERMTERTEQGIVLREDLEVCVETPEDYANLQKVLERLAAYEDTGAEPKWPQKDGGETR